MLDKDLSGYRDPAFACFHRTASAARFVDPKTAASLKVIDIDGSFSVEYDDRTNEPLLLVEAVLDNDQKEKKPSTVITALAARCRRPVEAYVVRYECAKHANPRRDWYDITRLRPERVYPLPEIDYGWLDPEPYFLWLLERRAEAIERIRAGGAEAMSRLTPDFWMF